MSHHKHEHGHSEFHTNQQESPEALAYLLWEQAGRPAGQSEHFWSEAEQQIKRSRRSKVGDDTSLTGKKER
ncbi:MAG: DUF2934 domain-containing protein [Planctomycetaceae bacterium]|nr:MAG: DUF2934 domain-containing protein [Planctomycetaceae bacterium]